ncbi:MAG: peptidase T [Clostridia bacterium]|nr:peptidase T [Clostridia bacterium]
MRYARVDTQSLPFRGSWPTTEKQADLARMLKEELIAVGVPDVFLDEKACVVYGRIPSNLPDGKGSAVGFIAHMDTAPDASGTDVKPWLLAQYGGGDIVLNEERNIVMRASEYLNLKRYIGQDLILTDGTTLLGGDDKAAIAAVMTMAEHLCAHPGIPHADVCIAFTPDEEVGGLARDLDLVRFGAEAAFTIDGDHLGWYEDETFYASQAVFEFTGRSVHTGTAKGIMINAADLAAELMARLPAHEKPQYTEGTEGFFHVVSCNADCEHARVTMIIRDFDRQRFLQREAFLRNCAEELQNAYGRDRTQLRIEHQYSNMKEILQTVPWLTEMLKNAIRESGIEPVCEPFRGGTDGAALSFRGLPCPNLSAGYENAHGRFEYVPVQSMEKNVEILLRIVAAFAEQSA